MFDKIMKTAENGYVENIETNRIEIAEQEEVMQNYSAVERIRMESKDSEWNILNGAPNKADTYSEELFNIIEANGYTIIEYGKRLDSESFYDEYCCVSEYYLVEKDFYRFIIKHLEDVDIDEGIFAVYYVVNKNTDEKIDFYLDLGCRNTGDELFEDFQILLSCESEAEYMKKKFQKYYDIEKLLTENDINVIDSSYNFSTRNVHGYIQVHENAYVVIYKAWYDEIRIVVTNNKTWDVNSSNNLNNIGYYVDYDGSNIDLLVENIKAFIKHITGQYGYLGGDIYYNNSHIRKLYDSIFSKRDKDGHLPEIFNHYHVRLEQVSCWDCRGYGNGHYINVFNGLEIADHRRLILNDAAQWSIGDNVNVSDIIVKYDRRLDSDNCILMIRNYQYNKNEDELYFAREEEYIDVFSDDNEVDKYLVDTIEIHDSFTNIMRYLYSYIIEICKKYNIDILKSDFVS